MKANERHTHTHRQPLAHSHRYSHTQKLAEQQQQQQPQLSVVSLLSAQRKTNEGQLSQFKFNKLMYYVQEVTSYSYGFGYGYGDGYSNVPQMTCNDTHTHVRVSLFTIYKIRASFFGTSKNTLLHKYI